ncbi:MAG: DUF2490 domain-containing protein [Bacteroidota bacterium]
MKVAAVITFLCLTIGVYGQESNLGNWIIYFGNKQINNKWNWHHEVQYRNYDAIGDLEQLLLRTGIGANLSENNNNLLLGYGYILSENYIGNDEKVSIEEHRIYQQFITRQKFKRLSIQHRYRFEQRFIEGIDEMRLRLRYFIGMNLPLSNKAMMDKTFYLSAYNELFINTTNTIFDRNRVYGGLGFKVNNTVRFELGYMSQLFSVGSRDQLNIISFVSF